MIRYYYKGIEPSKLSNKEWADAVAYLEIIRTQESENKGLDLIKEQLG
jgi:hypothetical protein